MAAETTGKIYTSGFVQEIVDPTTIKRKETEEYQIALTQFLNTGKLPEGYRAACHHCEPPMLFKDMNDIHNHSIEKHGKIGQRTKVIEPQPTDTK